MKLIVDEQQRLRDQVKRLRHKTKLLLAHVKSLRDELAEVVEWAVTEQAPLRQQEIDHIKQVLESTK